jgi:hypothetical protein
MYRRGGERRNELSEVFVAATNSTSGAKDRAVAKRASLSARPPDRSETKSTPAQDEDMRLTYSYTSELSHDRF